MSSSSLPLRASQDGSMTLNSNASTESTADRDDLSDVPLLSNLQLNDRRPSETGSLLRAGSSTSELAYRGTTIEDLPDELILEIFSYVSSSEKINVLQEVSTRWKILAQDAHLWHNWKYVVRYGTTEEEAVATFAAVPQLRTVIFNKIIPPGVIEALSRSCPHLATLEMAYGQVLTYSEADNLFSRCKEIRSLTIYDVSLLADVRFLDAVAWLTDLRVLHLWQCAKVNVEIPLRVLADSCPHLCDLTLGQTFGLCYRIQDAEYFVNSKKRTLKCLRIRWTSVEGRTITPLLLRVETLQNLELINDLGLGAAAEALPALGQLHSLRRLRLVVDNSEVRHSVPAVFGNGGLSNLQQVSLEGYTADETTRALAEHCSELRELELVKCQGHTDALLEPLRRLKKLEKLKIYSCKCLGGKAMSYIAKLPALRTLEFIYIKFDKLKPSVNCILEMSGLRRLYLHECICFAIPFDKFPGRLVNLRELEIGYCDGDQEVLDRICAQMPELKVTGSLGAWITDDEDYDDYYGEDDD